jgi:hypothetical protein
MDFIKSHHDLVLKHIDTRGELEDFPIWPGILHGPKGQGQGQVRPSAKSPWPSGGLVRENHRSICGMLGDI